MLSKTPFKLLGEIGKAKVKGGWYNRMHFSEWCFCDESMKGEFGIKDDNGVCSRLMGMGILQRQLGESWIWVIKLASWARSEVKEVCIIDEDGVVKVFNLEEGGTFTFSGGDDMLKALWIFFCFHFTLILGSSPVNKLWKPWILVFCYTMGRSFLLVFYQVMIEKVFAEVSVFSGWVWCRLVVRVLCLLKSRRVFFLHGVSFDFSLILSLSLSHLWYVTWAAIL